jgi:methylthioribose-1-phosphate isomerase
MVLTSLEYDAAAGKLLVLDQLLLPHEKVMVPVRGSEEAWTVIRKMQVCATCAGRDDATALWREPRRMFAASAA